MALYNSKLLQQAFSIKQWSVAHRRYLHQHPELSLKEQQTSSYCQHVLHELGYRVEPCWKHGFIADYHLDATAKTIAFRADMDALPIQENNRHDFISRYQQVAHLCGHDAHMAIALTTAKLLVDNKSQLKNNVRFIFQPSEELPPGGALGMIEQGCLSDVDEIYGLHNDPGTPVGQIKTRVGPLTAAADIFHLTIIGRGGHAACPQTVLDPIIAATQLITQWQSIISRRIDPNHPAILSVTTFQSGDTFNVIPDSANLSGTVRSFYATDRDLIQELMHNTLQSLVLQGYQVDFNYIRGYDPVINTKQGVDRLTEIASATIGQQQVDWQCQPQGWAEDFAYYLQHKSGAFYILGSGNEKNGITSPLHSTTFDIDEDCLPIGTAIMAGLAGLQ